MKSEVEVVVLVGIVLIVLWTHRRFRLGLKKPYKFKLIGGCFFSALLELLPAFQKQCEKCKKQLPIGLVLKLSLIVIRRDYISK